MDLQKFKWTRKPKSYEIYENKIAITTAPHTDLWQKTYYHFCNDNAPLLQIETDERFFSFIVKTDFEGSHQRFDQCGIVLYLNSENWLKASIEYENDVFQHRREDDYCIECSQDGLRFQQMRICHLHKGNGTVRFGVYACSPEESSFTAEFTELAVTECMWKAHDGQQPD